MSSRGRGGRGGGRGGRGPLPRDVQVSKKMSRILRHSAEDEGLKLGPGGYINVKDLLQTNTMKSLHVTFPELRAIVTSNDKQRFSLIPVSEAPSSDPTTTTTTATSSNESESTTADLTSSDDPSAYLIRANQGHSITSVDSASLLTPLTLDDDAAAGLPALCVHGTTAAAWPRILASGGLKPMKRNHVHLAAGLPAGFAPLEADEEGGGEEGEKGDTAEQKKGGEAAQGEREEAAEAEKEQQPPVISGMRSTSRVLIYVDLRRALGAGIAFWRSANGVILTEGDGEKKVLGVEFFKRVEDRKERKVLVRDGVVVGDGGVEAMKGEAEAADGKGRRGGRGGSGRVRGGWKDGRRGGAGEAF